MQIIGTLTAEASAEVIRGCCGQPDTACTCAADTTTSEE